MPKLTAPLWSVIALALLSGACHHAAEPTAKPAAAAAAPTDEGEQRADAVGQRHIGSPAPALVVKTIDGQTIDLAKLYGAKPVYLKFWATWCIPCRAQMPGFERTFETLGDQIQVISVNAGLDDDAGTVRAFRAQFGLKMPMVVDDGRLAAALDLQVTPQHVLIGRDAKIAFIGHLDGDRLADAIHKVLAAPAPAAATAAPAAAVRPAFRVGDVVQGIEAKMIDGGTVAIGPSRDGRPRAVVLFSAFCESYDGIKNNRPDKLETCRRIREEIEPLIAQGEVDWLGIAHNLWMTKEDVAEYRTTVHTKLPLAFDAEGALFRAFDVHQMPTVALIAADGHLVRMVGPDDHDLTAAVHALAQARR